MLKADKRVLDFAAVKRAKRVGDVDIIIPQAPGRVTVSLVRVVFPLNTPSKNTVEINSTIGVKGVTGIAQLQFRVFRDGVEIFRTQEGVEPGGSEEFYIVSFQALDFNVRPGTHFYRVTAQNNTPGTRADVVGPISISALAVGPTR